MAEDQSVNITGNDIESVAGKLEAFGRDLPPNERVVIDWLLQRASEAPADTMNSTEVQGYLFGPVGGGTFSSTPQLSQGALFSSRFNQALGFGSKASITVTGSIRVRGGSFGAGESFA